MGYVNERPAGGMGTYNTDAEGGGDYLNADADAYYLTAILAALVEQAQQEQVERAERVEKLEAERQRRAQAARRQQEIDEAVAAAVASQPRVKKDKAGNFYGVKSGSFSYGIGW